MKLRQPGASRTAQDSEQAVQTFKDLFSGHSGSYAEFRPSYPTSLFDYLASQCSRCDTAWDCATGNGQAARSLAAHFSRVIATDASEQQLSNAPSCDSVEYKVAVAEQSGLEDESVDLISVAQALHWFNIERFFAETERVLKPGGVLAVWCYDNCVMDGACDETIKDIFAEVEPYWQPERDIVESHYAGVAFPFVALEPDEFEICMHWTAAELLGYMRTWSASQEYMRTKGVDPTSRYVGDLIARWGLGKRQVRWPITLKISRK
jgi:SAM-dependent methyltransferase